MWVHALPLPLCILIWIVLWSCFIFLKLRSLAWQMEVTLPPGVLGQSRAGYDQEAPSVVLAHSDMCQDVLQTPQTDKPT